jgi:hypothetical protein
MTRKRDDEHSTEFGLWLRNQKPIDSYLGFRATNIDYVWKNDKTKDWMLIEEKRFMSKPKRWQREIFNLLTWCAKHHPKFHGFHLIQFEKTSPDDGRTFLDGNEISRTELIEFLLFKRFGGN